MPFLAKALGAAAIDGVRVFNPRRFWQMITAMPEAITLTSRRLERLRGLNRLATVDDAMAAARKTDISGVLAEQKAFQEFMKRHGRDPFDVLQESVGAISGLASAGSGAVLGGLSVAGNRHKKTDSASSLAALRRKLISH